MDSNFRFALELLLLAQSEYRIRDIDCNMEIFEREKQKTQRKKSKAQNDRVHRTVQQPNSIQKAKHVHRLTQCQKFWKWKSKIKRQKRGAYPQQQQRRQQWRWKQKQCERKKTKIYIHNEFLLQLGSVYLITPPGVLSVVVVLRATTWSAFIFIFSFSLFCRILFTYFVISVYCQHSLICTIFSFS